jgi:hypothetical protein
LVRKENTLHKRIRETRSKSVENPRSREKADADPIPPMNAIGAT